MTSLTIFAYLTQTNDANWAFRLGPARDVVRAQDDGLMLDAVLSFQVPSDAKPQSPAKGQRRRRAKAGKVTEMVKGSHVHLIVMAATFSLLLVVPGLPALANATAKLNLQPGEYEFSVTYEIQGEPSSRSKIAERCITPGELNSPEEIFSDNALDEHNPTETCKVKNLKESGQNISYDAECVNRLVHVEGAVRGTRFSVVRNVKPKTTHGVSLKFKLRGRRTGDCK